MGRIIDDYLPVMAMVGLQFCYSGNALLPRAALVHGMNPRVFVVYRQAIATLAIAPLAYFSRRNSRGSSMGLKSFCLIFLASLIGVTINQNIYFEGLYLASSSIASAMANLIPAITFLLASIVGMEKIDIWSLRTLAKITGTVLCVGGAIAMALLKGPKLLNANIFGPANESWLLGCSLLFGNACCWSIWLILQVPINSNYPDPLSSSAWMCLLATIQSATFTLVMEQELHSWILHSYFELFCCLFSGIVGSALAFIVQAWCISKRGPLFSAMFNPLSTVIVTFFAALFLHEEIFTGSLVGGFGVIIGLYVVLWGKAEDYGTSTPRELDPKLDTTPSDKIKTLINDFHEGEICNIIILEQPLLSDGKKCMTLKETDIKDFKSMFTSYLGFSKISRII